MANNKRVEGTIRRDLYVLEDENNPRSSQAENVLPSTILDQVYDDQSPTKKNLREILEELRQEIITGGRGNIEFPVTSVNGMMDDVVLTKNDIGLGRVDNTKDIDKPLSTPQKNAVMDILKHYDFNVDLADLYDHLMNTDNPHDVNIEQINKDDVLAEFVKRYIGQHSLSTNNTIHPDMRNSLRRLWALVDNIEGSVEERVSKVLETMDDHIKDDLAHINLFDKKEDTSNKMIEFNNTTNCDHTKYPSTRAVVEYVAQKLVEFNNSISDGKQWISDIIVIDTRKDLPRASKTIFNKAYLIKYGESSFNEIAICRMNPDGKTYDWDISTMGSYWKYNPEYFVDSNDGLTIKMDKVVDAILDENGALDSSLSEVLKKYYTRFDIDSFQFINHINMMPGTVEGSVRFYVNNDLMTMSEDIHVAGLQRLAFLEYVTEDELSDKSVHSRHILDKAIERRHLQDRAVGPNNIECDFGYVIGNDRDPELNTANCVSMQQLAEYLRPLIGGWPDPTVPGGNPWYDKLYHQFMPWHRWYPDTEYNLHNGSYGIRFKGTISCIPNMDHKLPLSDKLTLAKGIRILDAGGAWEYQSGPGNDSEWTVLCGSNITGHTFGTVTMDSRGLYFETISVGDRMDAQYDIWVKYIKLDESGNWPMLPPDNGDVVPPIDDSTIPIGITVVIPPNKTVYIPGENFDPTGMSIEVTYKDNHTDIKDTGYIITDGDKLTVDKTSVTVSYTESNITLTTTTPITVENWAIIPIGILVNTPPIKTEYELNENFDPSGLIIDVVYKDGHTKPISSGFVITDGNNLPIDKTYVTISYTENDIVMTCTTPISVTDPAANIDVSKLFPKDDIEGLKIALGLHDAEGIPEENIIAAVDGASVNAPNSIMIQSNRRLAVNTTEFDPNNYWKKSDVEEMKVALGMHEAEGIPNDHISYIIEDMFDNGIIDSSAPNKPIDISTNEFSNMIKSVTIINPDEYWTIDDIEEMKVALGVHTAEGIPNQTIIDIINNK